MQSCARQDCDESGSIIYLGFFFPAEWYVGLASPSQWQRRGEEVCQVSARERRYTVTTFRPGGTRYTCTGWYQQTAFTSRAVLLQRLWLSELAITQMVQLPVERCTHSACGNLHEPQVPWATVKLEVIVPLLDFLDSAHPQRKFILLQHFP